MRNVIATMVTVISLSCGTDHPSGPNTDGDIVGVYTMDIPGLDGSVEPNRVKKTSCLDVTGNSVIYLEYVDFNNGDRSLFCEAIIDQERAPSVVSYVHSDSDLKNQCLISMSGENDSIKLTIEPDGIYTSRGADTSTRLNSIECVSE